MRVKWQWWWYEVRKNGHYERVYLKRSDAIGHASVSQKVRGGSWTVRRITKKTRTLFSRNENVRVKVIAIFNGARYE